MVLEIFDCNTLEQKIRFQIDAAGGEVCIRAFAISKSGKELLIIDTNSLYIRYLKDYGQMSVENGIKIPYSSHLINVISS